MQRECLPIKPLFDLPYLFNVSLSELSRVEALLSCRLVLNLKRRSQRDQNTSLGRVSSLRVQNFTNEVVLGNIGAPLRDADEEWVDDFVEDANENPEEDEYERDIMLSSINSP